MGTAARLFVCGNTSDRPTNMVRDFQHGCKPFVPFVLCPLCPRSPLFCPPRHVRCGAFAPAAGAARARRGRWGRRDGARSTPMRAGKPRIRRSCKGKMRRCGPRARAGPWPAGPDRERLGGGASRSAGVGPGDRAVQRAHPFRARCRRCGRTLPARTRAGFRYAHRFLPHSHTFRLRSPPILAPAAGDRHGVGPDHGRSRRPRLPARPQATPAPPRCARTQWRLHAHRTPLPSP